MTTVAQLIAILTQLNQGAYIQTPTGGELDVVVINDGLVKLYSH
jgi:hypothetical protein